MKVIAGHNPLMSGPKVREVQELLVYHHFLPRNAVDGKAGPHTLSAFVAAKKFYGFPPAECTPSCGDRLYHVLKTGTSPFSRHDENPAAHAAAHAAHSASVAHAHQAGQIHAQSNEQTIRARIEKYLRWGIAHEPQIHYSQMRPMDLLKDLLHLPIYDDCSEFATKAYKFGGAPDPNGHFYNGLGYTGDMLTHMHPITLAQAKVGDLIVYGNFPGMHVVAILEPGHDPLTASHGQEAGPIAVRHSVEVAAHHYAPFHALSVFH